MSADTVTVHLHEPAPVSAPHPGRRSITDLDGPQRPRSADDREGRFCNMHGAQPVRHDVERLRFRHGPREVCPRCAAGALRGGTAELTLPADLPPLTPAERAALDRLRAAEEAGTAYARALVARGLPPEALSAPQTPAPAPALVLAPPARSEPSEGDSAAVRRASALASVSLVLAVLALALAAVALSA